MALKVSATTIHLHDKLPATIQIINRSGSYVHLARTVPSNDYVFAVVDEHGRPLPASTNMPFDLAMNGVTGQGFGVDPGQAFFEGFKDIAGYFGFPGRGVYNVTVTPKMDFKEHPTVRMRICARTRQRLQFFRRRDGRQNSRIWRTCLEINFHTKTAFKGPRIVKSAARPPKSRCRE